MPVVSCPPSQTFTPGVVEYSAVEFLASYPEFTGINNVAPASLANDFVGATFLLNNTCCSRVCDANQRLFLLYLLTAHIAAIHQGTNDGGILNPYAAFVGAISAASPGVLTVSAITEGTIAVGLSIYDGPGVGGSLVTPGTAVASFGTGTGGIGTYNLNIPYGALVAAESMIVPGVPNIVQPLGIVGRINNASEGDVSVAAEWQAPPNANQAYFVQTKYGADYWTMTARYRTALFLPAPPGGSPTFGPYGGFGVAPGPWGPYGP